MDSSSPISFAGSLNDTRATLFATFSLLLIVTACLAPLTSKAEPNVPIRRQVRQTLSAKLTPQGSLNSSTTMQVEAGRQVIQKRQPSSGQAKVKRFRTSLGNERVIIRAGSEIMNSQESAASNSSASHSIDTLNDVNNNARLQPDDVNNNTIQIDLNSSNSAAQNWTRNVDSINGTVDLSRYGQSGVDRLYGDALLVYLKNFNETLPLRKETTVINGTTGSVPVYLSEARPSRAFRWGGSR